MKGVATKKGVDVSVGEREPLGGGEAHRHQRMRIDASEHLRCGIYDDDPGAKGLGYPSAEVSRAATQVSENAACRNVRA